MNQQNEIILGSALAVAVATSVPLTSSEKAMTAFGLLIANPILIACVLFVSLLSMLVLLLLGSLAGLKNPFPIMIAVAVGSLFGAYGSLINYVGRYGKEIDSVSLMGAPIVACVIGFGLGLVVLIFHTALQAMRRTKALDKFQPNIRANK
jgi:hypothetical protein